MTVKPQSAAIPFRFAEPGGLEVMLISLSGEEPGWGFPKGGIKRGSNAVHTARMETLEEAGVLGEIVTPRLGSFRYRKRGRRHDVVVFAMRVEEVLARWQEESCRRRVWVPLEEAPSFLQREEFCMHLVTLRHRLLTQPRVEDVIRRAA